MNEEGDNMTFALILLVNLLVKYTLVERLSLFFNTCRSCKNIVEDYEINIYIPILVNKTNSFKAGDITACINY